MEHPFPGFRPALTRLRGLPVVFSAKTTISSARLCEVRGLGALVG